MTLKKMLLLAVSAMALAAFALPAAASADDWYTGNTKVGNSTAKDTVNLTGEIASTAGGGAVVNGPCDVTAHIDVWNQPTGVGAEDTGTGTVTGFAVTEKPCPAVVLGVPCQIKEVELLDLTWHIDVLANTVIKITTAGFRNVYENCPIGESAATGDATGVFNNANSCIEFANSGDLKAIPSGAAVTLDGFVCDDNKALNLKA